MSDDSAALLAAGKDIERLQRAAADPSAKDVRELFELSSRLCRGGYLERNQDNYSLTPKGRLALSFAAGR